jgi:hypothetical protein
MPEDNIMSRIKTAEAGVPPPSKTGGTGGGGGPSEVATPDAIAPVLAFAVTVGFFGFLLGLCFHEVPEANKAMLNIVLGSLGTAWVGAMAYFFGSTRGSQAKDRMLFQSQPAGTTA